MHYRPDSADGPEEDEDADDVDRDSMVHMHGLLSPRSVFLAGIAHSPKSVQDEGDDKGEDHLLSE
jgi:hypothetical protein